MFSVVVLISCSCLSLQVVKAYPAKKKCKSYVKIVYFGDNPNHAP